MRKRERRGEKPDLKVSRAAEKLAHLISNGSFNNIPRRSSPSLHVTSLLSTLQLGIRLRVR